MSMKTVMVNGVRMSRKSATCLTKANHHRTAARFWLRQGGKSLFKQELRARDGDACCYCGVVLAFKDRSSRRYATIEHLVPLSRGGSSELSNLALACKACNSARPNDARSLPEIIEEGRAGA